MSEDETSSAAPLDPPASGRRRKKPVSPFGWLVDVLIGAAVALLVVFVIAKVRNHDSGAAPGTTLAPSGHYTATIDTTLGTIVVALDANTPKATGNFVTLARKGFYNGLTFHRAVTNFVVQGGDPDGSGTGGPGYKIAAEAPTTPYSLGDLAYAKTATDPAGSAGSQFFIVTGSAASLNQTLSGGRYSYARFGHVASGIDVAKAIEALAPATGDGPPTKTVTINKVTINQA